METEQTTEGDIDTSNNEEGSSEETITISKTEWEKTNQTLGSLKRENKDLKKPAKEETSKKVELQTDYGLLAYLNTNEIKHEEDIALFNKVRSETGKKPEEILSSRYFQADLKEQRDTRESKEAQPSRNNRGTGSSIDEASNWANKIESGRATIIDVPSDLRYQVIQKRITRDQAGDVGATFMAKIAAKQANK